MDYQDIERHYQRLTQEPTNAESFGVLREWFLQQNQTAQLAELFEFRAGNLADPRERAEHLFQAALLWVDREKNLERGQRDLEAGFAIDPGHEALGDKLEELYRQAQNFPALSQLVTQRIVAVEQLGEVPQTARLRSRLYQNLGEIKERVESDVKEAIRCYKRAYAVDPTNLLALYLAREIYRRAGDLQSAGKLYELEIKAEPAPERKAALLRELSTLKADQLNDLDGAVDALERAVQGAPQDPDALYDLSTMLTRRSQGAGARPDDRKRAADCLYRLAQMAEPAQGLEYLEYGLDLAPEHEQAVELYYRLGTEQNQLDRLGERLARWYQAQGPQAAPTALLRALGDLHWDRLRNAEAAKPYVEALAARGDEAALAKLKEMGFDAPTGVVKPVPRHALADEPAPDFLQVPKAPAAADKEVDSLFGGSDVAPAPAPEPKSRMMPVAASAPADIEQAADLAAETGGVVGLEQLREEAQKLRMLGKDAEVEKAMERIVQAAPGDPEAVAYLERRYRAKGNFAGLHTMLMEAGVSKNLAPNVRVMRLKEAAALAEGRLSDAEGAVNAWKRVLNIDPANGDARRSLERLLRKLEKWADLVELMEQRVQMAEDESEKLQLLGRIAGLQETSLGDPGSTIDTYWRIHAIEERNVKHLKKIQTLSDATQRWEDLARALQAEADLVETPNEKLRALDRLLGVQHDKLNAFPDALATVDSILAAYADHLPTLKRQVELLVATGSIEAAADALDALVARLPDKEKPASLRRLAEISRTQLSDLSRAADALERALKLDPVNTEVREELHKMYEELGRFGEVAESFEAWAKATRDPAQRKQLLRYAAQTLDQKVGDLEAACQRYALILKDGEDPEALEAFARLYETQQEWAQLVDNTVRRANVAVEAEDKARLLREAALLQDDRLNEPAKAAKLLERILQEITPDHTDTLSKLVEVQVKAENHAAAAAALERLRELSPDPEEQLRHSETLGEWYRGPLQDPAQAISTYERIVAQWPAHGGALVALSELYDQVGEFEKLLRVMRARAKNADLPADQAQLLLEGARIAEEKIKDAGRAWGWYNEALQRDPDSGDLFDAVCGAGRRLQQFEQLAGLYEAAAGRAGNDDDRVAHLRQAAKVWEEDAQQPIHSLEDVVEAIKVSPRDDTLLAEADRLARTQGYWEMLGKAYDFLMRNADLADDRVALLQRFANVVIEDGRRPEFALGPLLRAMEDRPEDPDLFAAYEKAAQLSKHYEDLLRIYDKRCRALPQPDRWPLMLKAGEVFGVYMGNPQKAFQVVGIAIQQDLFSAEMAEGVMESIRRIEEASPADQKGAGWTWLIQNYERLADGYDPADPDRLVLHRRIADIHLRGQNDPAAAFEAFKVAHMLAPTDEQLVEDLEKLAREHNYLEALSDHFADALQRSMRVDVARDLHRRRAQLLEQDLNRPDEAADHYWQLLQLDPDDDDARKKIGAFYERVGRWNDLVVILEEDVNRVFSDDEKVALLHRIALIWEEKVGNRYEAIDVYRKLSRIRPDDEEIKEKIKKLSAPRLAGDEVDEPEEEPWTPPAPEPDEPAAAEPPPAPAESPEEPDRTEEHFQAPAAEPPAPEPSGLEPALDEPALPPVEEAPAPSENTGRTFLPEYDERDDSAKLSRDQLDWMAGQAGVAPAAPAEAPLVAPVAPAAPSVMEESFSIAPATYEEGEVPIESDVPLDTTGEIDTGMIQDIPSAPAPVLPGPPKPPPRRR